MKKNGDSAFTRRRAAGGCHRLYVTECNPGRIVVVGFKNVPIGYIYRAGLKGDPQVV